MTPGLLRFYAVTLAGAVSSLALCIALAPSCNHQLTVEEADAGLTAACVLLARSMASSHPEQLEQVLAQACQPGKTRQTIARVLAQQTAKDAERSRSTTELFPFEPPYRLNGEPSDPRGTSGPAEKWLTDAGVP